MTSIVGIYCREGVVIGTDSSATFGDGSFNTIEQPYQKIDIVENKFIIAGTGAIGQGQRFCNIVEKLVKNNVHQHYPIDIGRMLAKEATNDFIETNAHASKYGAMVAFSGKNIHGLCEFGIKDFQPELKTKKLWYGSMGSAQPITDPFLAFMREIFWYDGPPTLSEGVFATTWVLEHACKINPGGVNEPISIAVLEKNNNNTYSARLLSDDELMEHRQNIQEAKDILRNYRNFHSTSRELDILPLPTTPVQKPS